MKAKTIQEYAMRAKKSDDELRASVGEFIDDLKTKNVEKILIEFEVKDRVDTLFVAIAHAVVDEFKISAPKWLKSSPWINPGDSHAALGRIW